MKALFIAIFVGVCCFLSACKGHNSIEQHKETVAVKTDRISSQRLRVSGQHLRGEEPLPPFLVRTDNGEFYFFDEEIDQLIQQSTKFQSELADLGATSEAVVYKNLGVSYLEQGKVDEAVVAFRKAVQIAPRFIEAHYLLADAYSIKGEGVLSRKSLENAMALDGSYIIDIKIGVMDRIHNSMYSTPPAVIRFEEVIELPSEFFGDPDKVDIPREWESPPK